MEKQGQIRATGISELQDCIINYMFLKSGQYSKQEILNAVQPCSIVDLNEALQQLANMGRLGNCDGNWFLRTASPCSSSSGIRVQSAAPLTGSSASFKRPLPPHELLRQTGVMTTRFPCTPASSLSAPVVVRGRGLGRGFPQQFRLGPPGQQQDQRNAPQLPQQQQDQRNVPQLPQQQQDQRNAPQLPQQQQDQRNAPQLPQQQQDQRNAPLQLLQQQQDQRNAPLQLLQQQQDQRNAPLQLLQQQQDQRNALQLPQQQQDQRNAPQLPQQQQDQRNAPQLPQQQQDQRNAPQLPQQQQDQLNAPKLPDEENDKLNASKLPQRKQQERGNILQGSRPLCQEQWNDSPAFQATAFLSRLSDSDNESAFESDADTASVSDVSELSALQRSLLRALSDRWPRPARRMELQSLVGASSKAEVNRSLYGLQRAGLVTKATDRPPQWLAVIAVAEDNHSYAEATGLAVPEKTAVSRLQEWCQSRRIALAVDCLGSRGPPHRPTFVLSVSLNGKQLCTAEAGSLKSGRQLVCATALQCLEADGRLLPPGALSNDSQSVKPLQLPNISEQLALVTAADKNGWDNGGNLNVPAVDARWLQSLLRNPVSALTEWCQSQGRRLELTSIGSTGPPHKPRFIAEVKIDGHQLCRFEAATKRDARRDACDRALHLLAASGLLATTCTFPVDLPGASIGDRIAALVHRRFETAAIATGESLAGRKVLAGFALQWPDGRLSLLSLGVGNRCVSGDCLAMSGRVLHDCHAEIIARRALLRFFIQQLALLSTGHDLEDADTEAGDRLPTCCFQVASDGRARLCDGCSLHLYISTAPCGDGAVFCRSSDTPAPDPLTSEQHCPDDVPRLSPAGGRLRSKMERGEGTIPVEDEAFSDSGQGSGARQAWDGLVAGQRLRTMSCSDKICRWSILGLQGALLSHIVWPVYLKSLTLGSLYHAKHLARAVCCRVHWALATTGAQVALPQLPDGYRLVHLDLSQLSGGGAERDTERTNAHSLNWYRGCGQAEICDATRGRPLSGGDSFSRLCKFAIFKAFTDATAVGWPKPSWQTYGMAKAKASDHQGVKQQLLAALQKRGLGAWIRKPAEVDAFGLTSP